MTVSSQLKMKLRIREAFLFDFASMSEPDAFVTDTGDESVLDPNWHFELAQHQDRQPSEAWVNSWNKICSVCIAH